MVTVEEDKVVATPDVKNAPVSTDFQPSNDLANSENQSDHNVENSESQPNKDLSSSKAEVLPASETQASSADFGALFDLRLLHWCIQMNRRVRFSALWSGYYPRLHHIV